MTPPAYRRIAELLRGMVADGTYPQGAQLPSVRRLAAEHGVSDIVTRRALDLLRLEGLVEARRGRGYFVRVPPPERLRTSDRYRRHSSPFARDARAAGPEAGWESHTERVAATPPVAERLRVAPGTEVLQTHYRYLGDDQPVQLAVSYEPAALTAGTPVALPEHGRLAGQGVITRMDSIGHRVTEVVEEVTARPPTPDEASELGILPGGHVLHIVRTHLATDLPVETCDIVVSADRYRLTYRLPVPDG